MTENQLYTIGAFDFCDSSSNSSNLLKFELFTSGGSGGSSQHQQQQQNQQYTVLNTLRENPMLTTASISIPQRNSSGNSHQPRIMADFSEMGLDALDASSLSPTLLQDVSLNSMNGMNSQFNVSSMNNTNNSGENITLYDNQTQTTNSNTMWSDIGNAMTAMKSEPFHMEDDYIFQIDKADLIPGPTLAELNDEALLEDLIIDDLIHVEQGYGMSHHGHLNQLQLSPAHMNMGESSMPPQQLMQHHQQQQHQQHQQHQNQHHQNQLSLQLQNTSGHDIIYDEQNTTGSSSPYDIYQTTPTKSLNSSAAFSPGSQASSNSPLMMNSVTPPPHTSRAQFHHNLSQNSGKTRSPALQELLKKEYSMSPDRHVLGQSVPDPSTPRMYMATNALSPGSSGFGSGRKSIAQCSSGASTSRLSSSAPTHLGLDQIWQRREPRQHLLSTGSLAEAESFSSISTASVLSPEANDFSHDEGYSDFDSDPYEDYSSDNDSDNEDGPRVGSHGSSKGKERYFWQYNVQAKGPKGQRLVIKTQLEDPHVLNEVTDPVFSPNCSVRGIKVYKHSGKARKGDGNDLTPNPKKLHMIGKELDKLGRTINDMTPVSELPFNVRPKSRKEKNKLASRACRLKKKAQHEANKIKLYGLEIEHKKLLHGINDVKRILAVKYKNPNENIDELNQQIDKISKASTIKIAGTSTEFVNKVLDKVKTGVPKGGLEDLQHT